MKIIYFTGHKYRYVDLDEHPGSNLEQTLKTNLKTMSPLVLVNELSDAASLLNNANIEHDIEFDYVLNVP